MSVRMIGPKFYAWDANGLPLAYGKLYTYQTNTTTPKATYTTEVGDVANTNPVILNGEGYANVCLSGSYNMILKDKDENIIWSDDPVSSAPSAEWVNCSSATYIDVSTISVVGNVTSVYSPLRRVRIDNGLSGYNYSTIETSSYVGGETIITLLDPIVTIDSVGICSSIVTINSKSTSYKDISTEDLLTNTHINSDIVTTKEYFNNSNIGSATWVRTGNTGVAGSTDFTNGKIIDGSGNERIIVESVIDIMMFGVKRNNDASASTNTLNIQSAIDFATTSKRKCVGGGVVSINGTIYFNSNSTFESNGNEFLELKYVGSDGVSGVGLPGYNGGDAVVSTVQRVGGTPDETPQCLVCNISGIYVNLNSKNNLIAFRLHKMSKLSSASNLLCNYPGDNCIAFHFFITFYAIYSRLQARDFATRKSDTVGFYMNGVQNGINAIKIDGSVISKYGKGIVYYSDGSQGGLSDEIRGTTVEYCEIGIEGPIVSAVENGFTSLSFQVYLENNDIDVSWNQAATKIHWDNCRLQWGNSSLDLNEGLHKFTACRDFWKVNIDNAKVYTDFANTLSDRPISVIKTNGGTGFFRVEDDEFNRGYKKAILGSGYFHSESDGHKGLREFTADSEARRPKFGVVCNYNGNLYSLDQSGSTLYAISNPDGAILNDISVSGNSKNIVFHEKTELLYMIESTGLQKIDPKDNYRTGSFIVGGGDVTGLTASKDWLFVGANIGKTLNTINPLTETVVNSIALTYSISEISFYSPKNWVVSTHKFGNSVVIHSVDDLGVLTLVSEITIITFTTPIGIVVNDNFAFIADSGGFIHVLNLSVAIPSINKSIAVGAVEQIAYNPFDETVCAIDPTTGIAYFIDCSTLEVFDTVTVDPSGVNYITYNPVDNSFIIGSAASEINYTLESRVNNKIKIGSWATSTRPTITGCSRLIGINSDTNKLEHTSDFGATWHDAGGGSL